MRAFEIYLNDRKLCTAGLPAAGVVTSTLTWVRGTRPNEPESVALHVGGLTSETTTFIDWIDRELKEGDAVTVVVTDRPKASQPKTTRIESTADRRKAKLSYLRQLARELGYEIKRKT